MRTSSEIPRTFENLEEAIITSLQLREFASTLQVPLTDVMFFFYSPKKIPFWNVDRLMSSNQ